MVDILMAVYNGEKFVAEQIDSILAQSETDWHLIICDDMSKDRSFEIISGYAQKYPDKISAHQNAVPTGSAQANFMSMLQYAQSEYVMFSDQDDFWEKDKVKLTLARSWKPKTAIFLSLFTRSLLLLTASLTSPTAGSRCFRGLTQKPTPLTGWRRRTMLRAAPL